MAGAGEAPSGRQVELSHGDQRATVVEVGGGVRTYDVGGRPVLHGYAEDEMCDAARGQVLIPWPNRVAGGAYHFAGRHLQLALTQPEQGNAIHGLTRWANWTLEQPGPSVAAASHLLHPQPGYPFTLACRVEHRLGEDGLTTRIGVTNVGADPAPVGFGCHPYLTVGTPTIDTAVLRLPAATRLVTDGRGIPVGREPVAGSPWDFREPRVIGDVRLDTALTGLRRDADGRFRVRLAAPEGPTTLTVWADGAFAWVQVFSGDGLGEQARRSLAVEPMTCAPDAFNNGEGLRVVGPGESLVGTWGIGVGG
ncbi:MAG TPA: aldose 1-epimerase family protein [Frankiaceae bacterium]|nr:aldose 1-epimerase family protein [Frankiaceae bacterium]